MKNEKEMTKNNVTKALIKGNTQKWRDENNRKIDLRNYDIYKTYQHDPRM